MAALVLLAACVTTPDVGVARPDRFTSIVDDLYRISYGFPAGYAGYSPQPTPAASSRSGHMEVLGGVIYPPGVLDRVVYSTMFKINVMATDASIDASTDEGSYVAWRDKAYRASLLKAGNPLNERGPAWRMTAGAHWWHCVAWNRTTERPKVGYLSCSRPVAKGLDCVIFVYFGQPRDSSSSEYEVARERLEAIARTVSLARGP